MSLVGNMLVDNMVSLFNSDFDENAKEQFRIKAQRIGAYLQSLDVSTIELSRHFNYEEGEYVCSRRKELREWFKKYTERVLPVCILDHMWDNWDKNEKASATTNPLPQDLSILEKNEEICEFIYEVLHDNRLA